MMNQNEIIKMIFSSGGDEIIPFLRTLGDQQLKDILDNDWDGDLVCVDAIPVDDKTLKKVYDFILKAHQLGFVESDILENIKKELSFSVESREPSSYITFVINGLDNSISISYSTEPNFDNVWESHNFRSYNMQIDFILEKMEDILSVLAVFGISKDEG